MLTTAPALDYADVTWDEEGVLRSNRYNDVYFSRENGLEETRYVFLEHNHLPERFATLAQNAHFQILETGFGSGLNLLATLQLWEETALTDATLHYFSVEKHPLHPDDMARIHAMWPELERFSHALMPHYPPLIPGFHRIPLLGGRVQITLLWGDAGDLLPSLAEDPNLAIDAFFLDGFAPKSNASMWERPLFDSFAQMAHPTRSSFATFTAAGFVKRGLRDAGFTVQKTKGFGRKADMLVGEIQAEA